MTSIKDAATAWRTFWYDPADPYTLGIIRLLTGWMLVYNLLVWGLDLDAFFGPNGLQPLQTVIDFHAGTPAFSLWFYVPEEWITTVHWTCVGICAMFFLGIATRVTSVLAFVITISYSQRVPVANFGLDQILGMLCLYLAIGPSGACLSVDRWWKVRKARERGEVLPEPRHSSARTALRLIQFHMCVIYFWAGIAKLKGDTWFTGEAMWQVLANQEYQTMDMTWMAWIPAVPYLVAHVTVIWEMSFCVLVWNSKLRPWMLAIGTGMHFGIGAFLGMWTFGLVMTYAYFAFSDPAAWRRRLDWLTGHRFSLAPSTPVAAPVEASAPAVSAAQPATQQQEAIPATDPVPVGEPDWGFQPPAINPRVMAEATAPPPPPAHHRASKVQPKPAPAAQPAFDDHVVASTPQPQPLSPQPVAELADVADPAPATNPAPVVDPAPVAFESTMPPPENKTVADQTAIAAPEPQSLALEDVEDSSPLEDSHTPVLDDVSYRPPEINTPVIRPAAPLPNTVASAVAEMPNEPSELAGNLALNSESALLLITLCKNERNTLRRYFRKHDIVCRAATTAENALVLATTIKPVAVLVAGTQMQSEELATLLEDLEDLIDVPTLTIASRLQATRLAKLGLSTHTLLYPVSPGEIRSTLGQLLFGDNQSAQPTDEEQFNAAEV